MKDFLGKTVKLDDALVHCARKGTRVVLRKGIVRGFKAPYILVDFGTRKWSLIKRTDHCIVLPS